MNNKWKRGFEVAKNASLHSNGPSKGRRMGTALYSGNKLVSIGFNQYYKTHPKYRISIKNVEITKNIHAEMSALIKRQYYTNKNLIMYIYREKDNGELGCSRPCELCYEMLRLAEVKRVCFINENGVFVEEKL